MYWTGCQHVLAREGKTPPPQKKSITLDGGCHDERVATCVLMFFLIQVVACLVAAVLGKTQGQLNSSSHVSNDEIFCSLNATRGQLGIAFWRRCEMAKLPLHS